MNAKGNKTNADDPRHQFDCQWKSLFSGALCLLGASSASPSAQMLSLDHYQQAGWVDILVVCHPISQRKILRNTMTGIFEGFMIPITVLETKFCEVDPRKSKLILWCWTKNKKDNDSGSGIPVWPTRCCEVSAANSTSSLPQKHPLWTILYFEYLISKGVPSLRTVCKNDQWIFLDQKKIRKG